MSIGLGSQLIQTSIRDELVRYIAPRNPKIAEALNSLESPGKGCWVILDPKNPGEECWTLGFEGFTKHPISSVHLILLKQLLEDYPQIAHSHLLNVLFQKESWDLLDL